MSKTVKIPFGGDLEAFETLCESVLGEVPRSTFVKRKGSFELNEKPGMFSGKMGVTAFIRYADGEVTIEAGNSGFGPIQDRHVAEVTDVIQGLIERGMKKASSGAAPAPAADDDMVRCPKCGSTQIQLAKRGWTLATGLLGSGKNERVCMRCMYKF